MFILEIISIRISSTKRSALCFSDGGVLPPICLSRSALRATRKSYLSSQHLALVLLSFAE